MFTKATEERGVHANIQMFLFSLQLNNTFLIVLGKAGRGYE